MRHVIPGHLHRPGRHCGSTALSDVVAYRGWPLDEPWCFGLGAGLGAFHAAADFLTPSRLLYLRSATLEEAFFRRIGVPFEWRREPDAERARADLERHVARGTPLLLRCDLSHLPHYGSKTPFNGHVVVAWGRDDEAGAAAVLISDTHFEGLLAVPEPILDAARTSSAIPFALARDAFPVPPLGPPPGPAALGRLAVLAIRAQAEAMLEPQAEPPIGRLGVAALGALADDLPGWAGAADRAWVARFAYQNIERRGTGGGGFRRLYAEFLERAERVAPALAGAGLAAEMAAIAAAWTAAGEALRAQSEREDGAGLDEIAAGVRALAARETAFYGRARDAAAGAGA